MNLNDFLATVQGKLIVSCQAGQHHPLRDSATLARMAAAAVTGGAAAIRGGGVGGIADVAAIRKAVSAPLIGLIKEGTTGVYITPTADAALSVLRAGADVVAIDATGRPRPDGRAVADSVAVVHAAGGLVMADIASVDDAIDAYRAGADMISTTLAGYTSGAPPQDPDLDLVERVRKTLPAGTVVIAEGRYHHPEQAAAALRAGADAVVVGTAITDPIWITRIFADRVALERL